MNTLYETFAAAAARAPGKSFLCVPRSDEQPGEEYTYAEARERIDALRAVYRAAGYGRGHRVGLLLGTRPMFVFHFLAVNSLGCCIVPINPDYRHDELAYVMDHSEADIAIVNDDRVADMQAVAREMPRGLPVVAVSAVGAVPLPGPRGPAKAGDAGAHDACSILYTSGTTGKPKGCVLSNFCHIGAGECYRDHGGLLAIRRGEDRFYNPWPFHHVNNLTVTLTCAMLTDNSLVLSHRFSPNRWWPEIVATGSTIVHYIGIVPAVLLKQPPSSLDRAHKVRFGFGAGIEPQLHGPFEERFGFPLVEIWGMTETPRVFADNIEPRRIDTRAFGRPFAGYEAKVVGEDGSEVPRGQQGELLVRSTAEDPRRGFFSGYLKNEAATEEAWRGGWFHTGDVVTQSDDGMLTFVDRKKNIIRRAGENIAASEVEATIQTHEQVAQVAVVAVPDEVRDEEVMACVVLKPGVERGRATAESIFAWCHQRIAYFKAPGWMIFMDSLPLTPSQRLQKTKIFEPGEDPRRRPEAIDLTALKKRR